MDLSRFIRAGGARRNWRGVADGDHCKIANGPLAGQRLDEVSRKFGRELVGRRLAMPTLPFMLKFLFQHEKLSVQVHPDDAARAGGRAVGQTECCILLTTEPGAQMDWD